MSEVYDDARLRSDSGSDTSLSGLPIGLRREKSREENERGLDELNALDFSYLDLDDQAVHDSITTGLTDKNSCMDITSLNLCSNQIKFLSPIIHSFHNLQVLDLSQNLLTQLPQCITQLTKLTTLIASNNQLDNDSFPKDFGTSLAGSLKVLSLGGNQFKSVPAEILELTQLRSLYLGGNCIEEITRDIKKLENLRVLYLGGNQLTSIPQEIGLLQNLQSLSVCENRIRSLPSSIAFLRSLRSLALHKNLLTALPPEIVRLRGLVELSLRNNPLVVRFVKDFEFETPSLLELAGRAVKVNKLPFSPEVLPMQLVNYLQTARRCVNPKCKGKFRHISRRASNKHFSPGVYFDAHIEDIKFVDFCGIYRLPLLQYLCSPTCESTTPAVEGTSSDSDEAAEVPINKLRRVLLG